MARLTLPFALALSLAVSGCSTFAPSIPAGYAGPKAQLSDSVRTHSHSKADFFVAEQIDEARIVDSLVETRHQNHGRGMSMTPAVLERALMADRQVKVHIKGRTHYAAPILAMTGTVFQVKGVVEFVPAANARYVVRGELGDDYSAVWIEDAATQSVVGQKIEAKGSAKLGILEK